MGEKYRIQIAERIRAILAEKDWYQQDLVRASGFPKSYISLVLSGDKNLTLDTIEKLEIALESPILSVIGAERSVGN